MYKNKKIGLVIPCYKVSKTINNIVNNAPNFVDKIYLVDDKCPENSVKKVKSKSKKIKKMKKTRQIFAGILNNQTTA